MNTNHTSRKVISQIRHACDGKLLNRPVRALARPRQRSIRPCPANLEDVRRLRSETRTQFAVATALGAVALLFAVSVALLTLMDVNGVKPDLQQGLAAVGRFVSGLFS